MRLHVIVDVPMLTLFCMHSALAVHLLGIHTAINLAYRVH